MAHLPIEGGGSAPARLIDVSSAPAHAEQPVRWREPGILALKFFLGGAVATVATFGVMFAMAARQVAPEPIDVGVALGTCTLLFAAGVGFAVFALVRIVRGDGPGRLRLGILVAALPLLTGAFFTAVGAFLTVWATIGFARGRQLRRRGKVLLPPVSAGAEWCGEDLPLSVPAGFRPALARQWRENGRTEHASVAAFARLTLDLIALGAPARLIEDANRDARDEIRHAELCFSLARSLDGRCESPGSFPAAQHAGGLPRSRPLALARLAVSSLVDGALHEGLSARVIARLVKRCEEPAIREVLRELAADEGRHAAHGWDVVEWCLDQGGAPVAHALLGALRAIPDEVHSSLPAGARDGAWERFGIHGAAFEAEEHAKARAELARRVRALAETHLARSAA